MPYAAPVKSLIESRHFETLQSDTSDISRDLMMYYGFCRFAGGTPGSAFTATAGVDGPSSEGSAGKGLVTEWKELGGRVS